MGSGSKSKEKDFSTFLAIQASRRPTCIRSGAYVEPRSVSEVQEWMVKVVENAEQKPSVILKKSKSQSSKKIIKSQKPAVSADLKGFTIPKRSLWARRRNPSPIPAKKSSKKKTSKKFNWFVKIIVKEKMKCNLFEK